MERQRRGSFPWIRTSGPGCLIALAAFVAFAGGTLLWWPLIKLLPRLGVPGFLALLSAVTAVLVVVFLIDWEKVSGFYRMRHHDTWFLILQSALIGSLGGSALTWIGMWQAKALPSGALWALVPCFVVFIWLMDRKERRKRGRP